MDLNPVALDPSACIPHIPKTDLRLKLKMYGDAPVTLSDSTMTLGLLTSPGKFTTLLSGSESIL